MIKRKIVYFYDLRTLDNADIDITLFNNIHRLERAIANRHIAILHGYASAHSKTITDRIVEPFMFLGDKQDVRAFEISTKQNKSFKVARIEFVEELPTRWQHAAEHKRMFTDMFLYSGEEQHAIRLRLNVRAHTLMAEQYPHSTKLMTQEDEGHWTLRTDVVSYEAITRFILGLYDDVEIIEDEGLKAYIKNRIDHIADKTGDSTD